MKTIRIITVTLVILGMNCLEAKPRNYNVEKEVQKGAKEKAWQEKREEACENKNDTNYDGKDLKSRNFKNASLSCASFRGANAKDADFQNADLTKADFAGTQLQGAQLQEANLTGANFRATIAKGAQFQNARLKNVNFVGAQLGGADFTNADLTDAINLDAAVCFNTAEEDSNNVVEEKYGKANFSGATWIDGKTICEEDSIGYCKRQGKSKPASGNCD